MGRYYKFNQNLKHSKFHFFDFMGVILKKSIDFNFFLITFFINNEKVNFQNENMK